MGKLRLELLLRCIRTMPGFENATLSETRSFAMIDQQFNSSQRTFLSDFYRSFSINNNAQLSEQFPGIDPSSSSEHAKIVSEQIDKELKAINCTDEEKVALAILATQNGGIHLNIVSLISKPLLDPWNIVPLEAKHNTNIYKQNGKIHCAQNFYQFACLDLDEPDKQKIQFNSPFIFDTYHSLTKTNNDFTYTVDQEEITYPNDLKDILNSKIEAALKILGDQITDQQLISLIVFTETDANLKISIGEYLIRYTGFDLLKRIKDISPELEYYLCSHEEYRYKLLIQDGKLNEEAFSYLKELAKNIAPNIEPSRFAEYLLEEIATTFLKEHTEIKAFEKINEINPQYAIALIADKNFLHKLVFKNNSTLNEDFITYLKKLAFIQNCKPNLQTLVKTIIEQYSEAPTKHYGDTFKFELVKSLVEDLEICGKQISQEKLTGLVSFALADTHLADNIAKHLRKFTELKIFKEIKAISSTFADKLVENDQYNRVLIFKDGKINRELFKYLESLARNPDTQSETLLQRVLGTLTILANQSANLRASITQHIQKYTSFNFFKEIYVASPKLALYLFRDKAYRYKLLFQDGKLNEDFFSYLTELAKNPIPNSESLRFAGNLCYEIIQDKKLIPKLIGAEKFGDKLFTLPTEGLTHLNNATPENIVGEIVKSSEILIDTCLSNTKLRAHFSYKMPTLNAALAQQDKHIGLVTHVLLADRKQHKPNSELYQALLSEQSARTIIAAAKQDRILSLKLLKTFKLTSAAKTELMLSHPNSKKIAKQIFQRYSWPKRWFFTSPCYKLNPEDLLVSYARSAEARRIIQNDQILLKKSASDIQIITSLARESKLTKDEIIELYATHPYFRKLINIHKPLTMFFLDCFDNELAVKLGCNDKHIAALYLLYPELRAAILADSYFSSRLFNNTDKEIVKGLLATDEFKNVTDEIKNEMRTRANVNSPIQANNNIASSAPIIEEANQKAAETWKNSIQGLEVNKKIFNAVCSSGFFYRKVEAKTFEKLTKTYSPICIAA